MDATAGDLMLQSHLKSKLHDYCSGLATAHRSMKRAIERSLMCEDERLVRLFRTAFQVIDVYGSFLSFEKWVRVQDLNGTDMGNRNHSEFTMRAMVKCTAKLWLKDLRMFLQQKHPLTGRESGGSAWLRGGCVGARHWRGLSFGPVYTKRKRGPFTFYYNIPT